MDPMDAIRQTFFQECEEQLAELESGLLALEAGEGDGETVNAVFRAVHSVKGGAGAFGLDQMVRFAHVFETTMDALRSDRLQPEIHVLKAMLRGADVLADLVRAARDGVVGDETRANASAAELAALVAAPSAAAVPPPTAAADPDGMAGFVFQPLVIALAPAVTVWTVCFRPHPAMYAKANDAGPLLRELGRLGPVSVTLDASELPDLAAMDPEGSYLAWTARLETDQPESAIREVFEFVEGDCDLDITQAGATIPSTAPAIDAPPELDVMALIRNLQSEVAPEAVVEPVTEPDPHAAAALHPKREDPAAAKRDDPVASATKPTIRVDLDRVDRLIDLVGELVINQAMIAQRVLESGFGRSSTVAVGLEELEQLTREIQDSVMAIRAQPVKSVFQRMPRLVREVAAMTGKQVRLVTEGEATEVDKTVIEHLSDPLTHMIRNAIDHGVETPAERRLAGKPEEGTVRMAALHRSGRIVIEVGDDGAGINRARVRESAIAKGLVPPDAVLSDDEIDNLIFLPGFSTAATISNISGRGVGMDVVRRSIQALGGRISIASRPGQGSTFTMSLPLTLAVLDGMVVTVQGQTLIVPLTAIIETLQPRVADVHGMGGDAMVIAIRGTYVPLIDVGASLGWSAAQRPSAGSVALLIEGEGGRRAALMVDGILGQRQVVIKSLEANYRHVPGVAAATILGDGRVALILDVDTIVSDARQEPGFSEPRLELGAAHA
jgi:two-component system chemotaxis sensor kinase CheA